jgi:tRNA-2-methylthio-N6-dimethylallyladenosine synthase
VLPMDDRLVGQNVEILCEGPSKTNEARLTGRTGSNCIVVFEGNRDRHLGEIFNVCVTEAANFGSSATPTVLLTQDEPQTPLCHIASF